MSPARCDVVGNVATPPLRDTIFERLALRLAYGCSATLARSPFRATIAPSLGVCGRMTMNSRRRSAPRVVRPNHVAEDLPRELEDLVPRLVPLRVVVMLEVIQVEMNTENG